MQYGEPVVWIGIAQLIMNAVAWIYAIYSRRNTTTDRRMQALESETGRMLDEHADRLARIEEKIRHLPTHSDVGLVFKRIDQIHGDLRQLAGTMEGLSHAVNLINEYLLNGRGKG